MSSKRKRLGLIVISIILTSFSAGWIIRGFSEGGNPTIDPIEGIFNMPWFNATRGIRAPEFYHEVLGNYTAWVMSIEGGGGVTDHGALTGLGDDDHGLYLLQSGVEGLTGDWDVGNYDLTAKYMTADEFYHTVLGNYTAWVESQSGGSGGVPTYDYVIYQNGSMVDLYNGHTFELEDSHSQTWVVAEWAVDNLSSTGGSILFVGDFDLGEYTNLDSCDSGWQSDDVDVTVNVDSGDKKEGTASTELIVASGFTTGLMAHKQLPSPMDLSDFDMLGFWAKGTVDFGANKLSIALDNDADCSSPHTYLEYFHTENLGTVWKYISAPSQTYYWGVPLDLSGASVVNSIGIYGDADPGAVTINIDDFDAQRGVIKITNGKPYQIDGRGTYIDSINLNAHCNMPMLYVTSDNVRIEQITLNGREDEQEAIDACTTIYYHYADHVTTSEVFVKNVKGTGIKHRDLSYADILNCRGNNTENPFVSGSGVNYIKAIGGTSEHVTNDDHYWFTSGTSHIEVADFRIKGSTSGGIRAGTGSGEWHDINIHDGIIEDVTLQFIQIDDADTYDVVIERVWCNQSDGVGFRLSNFRGFKVSDCRIGFTKQHAMFLTALNNGEVSRNTIESANYDDVGSYDGIRHSSHKVTFTENTFVDYSHGGGNFSMHRCIKEEGTPEDCEYPYNKFLAHLYSPAITIIASDSRLFRNVGYVTENADIATLVSGQTSIVVSHGCDYTPSAGDISVTAIEDLGAASYWYFDTITSSQFTIHVNVNPTQDVDFAWSVNRH